MYILSVTSGNVYLCKSLCRRITLPSDTYFKNGVSISIFIYCMQRNLILTDVMKTGACQDVKDFIDLHSIDGQVFECESEYYNLHNYNLDSYDRKFAIIDSRFSNNKLKNSRSFNEDLVRRCGLLHSQGFTFVKNTAWESKENIKNI